MSIALCNQRRPISLTARFIHSAIAFHLERPDTPKLARLRRVLRVEPGNSMPFFRHYRIQIDEGAAKVLTSGMEWKLHAGRNQLMVAPADEFGQTGSGTSIALEYNVSTD
jgi:hypothetical protein